MSLNPTPDTLKYVELKKDTNYITGEIRARNSSYADPLTLCFKLLLDFDRETGFISTSNHPDTALNYFKRIGDEVRYGLLERWIDVLKIFISHYDFLIEEITGLDIIKNSAFGHSFLDDDKVELTIRETSDMMIEALIMMYRQIAYDDVRGVEVLPSNLRKFDLNIVVYNSGYFNMLFYDETNNPELEDEIIAKIFPTLRKISDGNFSLKTLTDFNHVLYNLGSCSINIEESGKNFISTVSNIIDSSYIKNNLVLNYKFASVNGRFNNTMGQVDYVGLLAMMAAYDRVNKGGLSPDAKTPITINGIKTSVKDYFKNTKNELKAEASQFKDKLKTAVKDKAKTAINNAGNAIVNNVAQKIKSKTGVIGNLISKLNVDTAKTLIKNTIDIGLQNVEDKFINNPITKLNNLLFQNFSNNLYDIYNNNFGERQQNIELLENEVKASESNVPNYVPDKNNNVEKGIKFEESYIYKRKGF